MSKKYTWIEKLEQYIPGFSGYKKRELAREDDRLLRNYLIKLLIESKNRLEDAAASLVEFDFSLARRINILASDVRLAADKLKFAETGYAPHYNRVKVTLKDLDEIKDIDGELVELVNRIHESSKHVYDSAKVSTVKPELLSPISVSLSKVGDVLERRIKVLRGWSNS